MNRKTRVILLIFIEAVVGLAALHYYNTRPSSQPAATGTKYTPVAAVNHCDSVRDKVIIVSIQQRHLWACNAGKSDYDSSVITGYTGDPSNLTPPGTYKIYAKQTNRHLRGSDDLGSWDDYVYYWMPFLNNQYGAYGFHDATWRDLRQFGNVDPRSKKASHGCVELPLETSKWLYDWSDVGTLVQIQA